jgi:hypothetical protein
MSDSRKLEYASPPKIEAVRDSDFWSAFFYASGLSFIVTWLVAELKGLAQPAVAFIATAIILVVCAVCLVIIRHFIRGRAGSSIAIGVGLVPAAMWCGAAIFIR